MAQADGLRERILQRFAGTKPGDTAELRLAGLPPELSRQLRHLFPAQTAPAAVLIPLIDRESGLTVLLTERAADLKHHPSQICFPGGRVETGDGSPAEAALRETQEEIGLDRRFIEVIGYLPDHLVVSGYQVTPVIAFVRPGFELKLDTTEVAGTFEVPLEHLLDAANHKSRRRVLGETPIEVYDIPFGERNIWGATAGMLMTLSGLLARNDG